MNWFTSDLHINHENIIKYCSRPFENVNEMNEEMVKRWNERVTPDDTIYVVGDMFLGKPENAVPIIKRLNGKKVLVLGNHDRSPRTMVECGFDEVWQRKNIRLMDDRRALLCHKPLPESTITHVEMQVHGHRHEGPIVSGRRINACVDLWDFRPISEEELCAIQLGPAGFDEVVTSIAGDMVEVRATVRREDMEGLLDHLHVFSRTIWGTSRKE